jgi:hypothetical protein
MRLTPSRSGSSTRKDPSSPALDHDTRIDAAGGHRDFHIRQIIAEKSGQIIAEKSACYPHVVTAHAHSFLRRVNTKRRSRGA